MGAKIIDGKKIADKIKYEISQEIADLKKCNIYVTLAVILVGNNSASKIYVDAKKRACEDIGINSKEYLYDEKITENELLSIIEELNNDKNINGILVQCPLPKHINENRILESISPFKDVDGFSSVNIGNMFLDKPGIYSCTPLGCLELIKSTGIDIKGLFCVIVGKSNIVGKPMSILMMNQDATVCVCHIGTKNLSEFSKKADILIVAAGHTHLIKKDMVKEGSIVIDVGINRTEGSNKICGDVDFENVKDVAGYITPVPGGVGPMTIAMLMKNTLNASKIQNNLINL